MATKHSAEVTRHITEPLLDTVGAAEFFGFSPRKILDLVAHDVVPPVRIPGTRGYRFRAETLRRIAEKFEQPTMSADGGSR